MSDAASELAHQHRLLATDIGTPASGAVRYAAAMYFYAEGLLPAETLEIYRRCCNIDDEDPVDLARFEGVAPPPGSP